MKASSLVGKLIVASLFLVFGLSGCGEGSGHNCNDIAWVSLGVHTLDASGQPMAVERVEYSHNGADTQQAYADQVGEYALWNGPGTYEVTATACGGNQTQTGSYEVPEGSCGADTSAGIPTLELVFDACVTTSTYTTY